MIITQAKEILINRLLELLAAATPKPMAKETSVSQPVSPRRENTILSDK